jgi:very-short-patch-repair endonuclease
MVSAGGRIFGKPRKPGYVVGLARANRRAPTAAERIVWGIVRNRQVGGVKFRRQAPYGRYVLDLYSKEIGLAIEIDGASHDARHEYDCNRDAALAAGGIQAVRIRESDVIKNADIVREMILAHKAKRFGIGKS